MGKKIRSSLSAQLLCGALGSILAAAAVFFGMLTLGNVLLDHTVYGRPFVKQMTDIQFSRLQDYVLEEEISRENLQRLDVWHNRGRRVYLSIYQEGENIYTSSFRNHIRGAAPAAQPELSEEDPEYEYPLLLSDDQTVQAFLYYYAGDAFYFGLLALSVVSAFLTFCFCFVLLVHRKLAYIKKLKEELDILSGGALEYPVTVQGSDELGSLAFGIDQMRRSILSQQQTVERTRQANSQLVTTMSHDLRTPLTALLAYLELIDRGKYQDEAQLREFVKKSLDKAFRIKNMADQMFEYFLVSAAQWEQPELEPEDADTLFIQVWGDYALALECKGFAVTTDFAPLSGSLKINPELLRRAFDNLYSNLLKYADPGQPIEIRYRREEQGVTLTIRNAVSPRRDRRESTRIGLGTCQRILQYHGGSFQYEEKGGHFRVTVQLPFQQEAENLKISERI